MDKLQYDSLYKFFVSLGIVLIILPFALLVYLMNREPILISRVDFCALSGYSHQMIGNQMELTSYFLKIFPIFGAISFSLGCGSVAYGVYKWNGVQGDLDKKINAEATIQALDAMKMTAGEIKDKEKNEVEEGNENIRESGPMSQDGVESPILKYREIEDKCYAFFERKYGKKYDFNRNIRMGKYNYDFIGVSQLDNVDLVVEIKYYKFAAGNSRRLYDVFERFSGAGVNYETIAHRNFRCIVVVVTPKEQLPKLETIVETYCRAHRENAGKIEIKPIAEEAL